MPNIHHQLLIATPTENVYNALTTAEGLSGWWTPGASAEPKLNSVARFPFGDKYFKEMKIIKLESPVHVKWQCITGDDEWIGTTLSFTLRPGSRSSMLNSHRELLGQIEQQADFDNGTVLMFQHNDWRDHTNMFAECSYTWALFLRSLKLYCETGQGLAWPNQHVVKY